MSLLCVSSIEHQGSYEALKEIEENVHKFRGLETVSSMALSEILTKELARVVNSPEGSVISGGVISVMRDANKDLAWVGEWFGHWWPALALAVAAYVAIKFLVRSNRKVVTPLDKSGLTIHEICTTLACTEQQAKKLLAMYGGNVSKAIQDVKTGKAVLPGSEVSDLALFGGEFKRFESTEAHILLHTQDGSKKELSKTSKAFLALGVVDRSQRPDKLGLGRGDRGQIFGQLFWEIDGEWHRFLLNASRMDYFDLGERKQNSSARNFRVVLNDLCAAASNMVVATPLDSFENDLRLPHYKELTELEADASQSVQNWSFEP